MVTNFGSVPQIIDSEPTSSLSLSGKILIVDDEKFNCDIIYGFLLILGV
jgi:hypothetical protein